ncbi:cyclic nucleotide-gated ion channel [Aureococcus anophagefferens]|nr:cyclic nucleotide-gated ion channel [Aureococcus anophagefferens]
MASRRVLTSEIAKDIQKIGEPIARAYRRTSSTGSFFVKGRPKTAADVLNKTLVVSGFELKCQSHFGPERLRVVERENVVEEKHTRLQRLLIVLDILCPMMHPLGTFHVRWDSAMVVVILLCVVMTPFQMAFPARGCVNPWALVKKRRTVAEHYVRGWFLLDFAASVPFNHILNALAGCKDGSGALRSLSFLIKILKTMKMVRLLRIIRLVKLMRTMDQWGDSAPSESTFTDAIRFSRLVLFIMVLSHLAACVLVIIADPNRPDVLDGSKRSWVTNYYTQSCFVPIARQNEEAGGGIGGAGTECAKPTTLRLYTIALYWAVTTLTTVGYGDVSPHSSEEMLWSIIVQFVGTCSLGYIMGEVTAILTQEDKSAEMIREKIDAINAYMRFRKLPVALQARIRNHYSHMWKRTTVWDEPQILEELPRARAEVLESINTARLQGITFIYDLGNVGDEATAQLSLRLTPQLAHRHEPVVRENHFGNDLYIMSSGRGDALFHDAAVGEALSCDPNVIVRTYETGDYFCEYALFLAHEAKHPFTVRARNTCELFTLNRKALVYLAEHFPNVEARFLQLCEKRHAEMVQILSSPYNLTLVQKPEEGSAEAGDAADSRHLRRQGAAATNGSFDRLEDAPNAERRESHLNAQTLIRMKLWSKKAVIAATRRDWVTMDGFDSVHGDDDDEASPPIPEDSPDAAGRVLSPGASKRGLGRASSKRSLASPHHRGKGPQLGQAIARMDSLSADISRNATDVAELRDAQRATLGLASSPPPPRPAPAGDSRGAGAPDPALVARITEAVLVALERDKTEVKPFA